MNPSFELDHVGIVVSDLDSAEVNFTRLGFALTPRSFHQGSPRPGEPVRPMGSANHCAMFEEGYLELMGIWNPALWSTASEMIERYEGLHIIALRNYDAAATHVALSTRLASIPAPRILRREVDIEGTTRTLEFHNIVTERDAMPEARFIFIEHKTPDLLWRRDQMTHPNGAVGIADAYVCPLDHEEAVARLSRVLDTEAERPAAGVAVMPLARGRLTVYSDGAFAAAYPGVTPPLRPSSMGATFTVRDLGATRRLLESNGVDYNAVDDGIWVGPVGTNGTVVGFREL